MADFTKRFRGEIVRIAELRQFRSVEDLLFSIEDIEKATKEVNFRSILIETLSKQHFMNPILHYVWNPEKVGREYFMRLPTFLSAIQNMSNYKVRDDCLEWLDEVLRLVNEVHDTNFRICKTTFSCG